MNTTALSYADKLELAAGSRQQALQQLFDYPLFSLTSLMGPVDGPDWPSDAAWLVSKLEGEACLISDGLSDPWVEPDRPQTGLGLEVLLVSSDFQLVEGESAMVMADTWMFPMIAEISHTLACYPRLCSKLLAAEPLSLRFNIEHIKDGRGLVGALLHQPRDMVSQIDTEFGPVQLIAATLLTGKELSWLVGKGEEGRRQLLERLYDAGVGCRSLGRRASVVE
ncbi:hypothetical protein [Oceanobacter mangrovi]|uniref:hypothetical protein n=1 Tax=Oceanobacter mangrovi TaxID=2862510 RepID=UPI001C8E3FF8|nr:hypothetical protein [Oceanobacter mangrovi]